jgi:hypothetical protein
VSHPFPWSIQWGNFSREYPSKDPSGETVSEFNSDCAVDLEGVSGGSAQAVGVSNTESDKTNATITDNMDLI